MLCPPLEVIVEELRNISKNYPMVKALQGVSLKIREKQLLLIRGPSGSGKSTLMHIAGLLDLPSRGEIKIMGKRAPRNDAQRAKLRSDFMGFVFQQFALMPSLTVLDNILLPTVFSRTNRDGRAAELAESLGIEERLKHFPNQISGGEKQRVALARALVNDPRLIFADEPTGNLDSKTGEQVMKLLRRLADGGKAVVVVSHNPEHDKFADTVIRMRDGKIL